ncbi:MAG: hypothetical protein KGZ71_01065 [Desulfobulbaceae bacterium]|nr:hypothetical protein [Desulfobulbaceae bacterium]
MIRWAPPARWSPSENFVGTATAYLNPVGTATAYCPQNKAHEFIRGK